MSEVYHNITPIFMWTDRKRLFRHLCKTKPPLPLILSFLVANRKDMEQSKWRKLNGILDLPDEIAYGLLCAIVEPRRQRINWPKKKSQAPIVPLPFRHDDFYYRQIMENDMTVRNEVRLKNEELPKWLKKTMEKDEWL